MRCPPICAIPLDPIWISLDDYRGWFSSGKGKVADAIGVTILDTGEGFELLLQVGEAKFVGMQNELAETKEALKQVRATMDRLARIFIDNEDEISRAAWCTRLVNLLVDREGLSERIPDPLRRAAFVEQMVAGDVRIRMSGEAVVCLHDYHATSAKMERDVDFPHLRYIVLPTPLIRKTLHSIEERALPELDGLTDVRWYPESPMSDSYLPEASQRDPVPAFQDGEPQSISAHLDREEPDAPELVEEVATNRSSIECERTVVDELPEANPAKDPAMCTPETLAVHDGSASRFIPLPVYDILSGMASHEQGAIDDSASIEWVEQICRDTQRALSHFDMQAHFAEPKYRLTPNGTLLTFRGHPSLTVDRIEKRQVQLLTTHGIEVVDVRPGRGQISLFVKREKRAKVPLASTWLGADWPDRDPGEMMSFILGAREDDDKLLYLNLAGSFADYEEHGPHTLIAGETGSGKGVLTQGLLLQMIAFNDPGTAELILVDPKKGVDFGWLNGAPHLKQPIVTEVDTAASVFANLVAVMDARYQLLVDHGVPHIGAYNRKVPPEQRLSRIFLVHDELGAWMAQGERVSGGGAYFCIGARHEGSGGGHPPCPHHAACGRGRGSYTTARQHGQSTLPEGAEFDRLAHGSRQARCGEAAWEGPPRMRPCQPGHPTGTGVLRRPSSVRRIRRLATVGGRRDGVLARTHLMVFVATEKSGQMV